MDDSQKTKKPESNDKAEVPAPEVPTGAMTEKQITLRDILDATIELTKAVGDLAKELHQFHEEWELKSRAGKF